MTNKISRFLMISCILLGFSFSGYSQTNLINDGSFEAGIPNPDWNEFSSNFGSPLCTTGACGLGGGTGPLTGSYWVWFGGIDAVEIGSIDQTVTIPAGSAELRFWLENPSSSGSGNDFIQVQIDDIVIFNLMEGNPLYATYNEVIIDISTYADGNPHKIEFYSECTGAGVTNFFVDDVSLINIHPVPFNRLGIVFVFLLIGTITIIRFKKSKSLILNN